MSKPCFVYVADIEGNPEKDAQRSIFTPSRIVKIGFTTDPTKRLHSFQSVARNAWFWHVWSDATRQDEEDLHYYYSAARVERELFQLPVLELAWLRTLPQMGIGLLRKIHDEARARFKQPWRVRFIRMHEKGEIGCRETLAARLAEDFR